MAFNSKTQTFDSIADLRTRAGVGDSTVNVSGYYTPDDGGGGQFYYDETSEEDDNGGLIIQPTPVSGAGRWKRLTQGRIYNILWWGAKADGITDTLPILERAIASVPNIPQPYLPFGYNLRGTFYFPGSAKTYYFSDTFNCYDAITIIGDEGMDSYMATVLYWPTNTTGIHVRANQDGVMRGSHGFRGANFKVKSVITTQDYTNHGILFNRPGHLNNVHAEGFGGAGFCIQSNIEGIADIGYMVNCSAYSNGLAGLYTIGVDSNQWVIENINVFGNTRFGVWEKSFLGNTYISPHSNSNTVVPNNPVWCFNNGETYACIADNTNKEPGVAADWEDYWVLVDLGVGAATLYYPQWTSSFNFLEGGCYVSEGDTNASDWGNNWYSEGGQAPNRFASYNKGIRGPDASGIVGQAAMIGAERGMSVFFGGAMAKVNQGWNQYPLVEATMDNLGFSMFPINQSNGNRLSTVGTSFQWIPSESLYAQIFSNTFGESAYWIITSSTNASWYGRAAAPNGYLQTVRGFFMGIQDSYPHGRMIGFSNATPVTTGRGVGDLYLKRVTGASDTTLGWRCVASGTPDTWEEITIGGSGFTTYTVAQRDLLTPTTSQTIYCSDAMASDASTGVVQTWNGATWKNHW